MLGIKNHFDISDSIEIREVDIAGVACIYIYIYIFFFFFFTIFFGHFRSYPHQIFRDDLKLIEIFRTYFV